jgi:hypothetical protein
VITVAYRRSIYLLVAFQKVRRSYSGGENDTMTHKY